MPAHTDTMMMQGLHRRFEGQQEKQVVIDNKLWPVKTHLNRISGAERRCLLMLTEFDCRGKQTC